MGSVPWLAVVAAMLSLGTTVRGGPATTVPTVVIHLAADITNTTVVDKVTLLAARHGGVYRIQHSGAATDCVPKEHLTQKKDIALIYVTDSKTCNNLGPHEHRLLLTFDAVSGKLTPASGQQIAWSDDKGIEALVAELIGRTAKGNKELVNPAGKDVGVPVWAVIVVGIVTGVLLAGNCILFSKLRARKNQPMDPKSSSSKKAADGGNSSKRSTSASGKSQRKKSSGGSSRSSSSKSGKKRSSRGRKQLKVEVECRSSKTLSTKTCGAGAPESVKVVPVGKKEDASLAKSTTKDEVATVMASRAPLPDRCLDRRIDLPMTEEEFMVAMKKVIEFVIEYYRNPTKYPVSSAIRPGDIFNQLPQRAPENPDRFDAVWNDFHEVILKGCLHWQHPQFHAFFPCGRSYPDILAETIISSLGTVGFTWSANPAITELDTAMVNWIGRALGIPESFLFTGTDAAESTGGGWIADSASDVILCAIMAARHTKIEQELAKLGKIEDDKAITESNRHTSKRYEKRAEIMSKLVAYGSYESHSSFEKACKLAAVRCRPIKVFEKDDWGMRREHVEKEMEKDRQRGLIPFYLHVALGTTSTATSDHLDELTPLKQKYDVWVHVDAAYAGSAWVVEKYRKNAGIDKADSININLHKFFLTSTSVTFFWTSRQREYKEGFRIDPAYLKKKKGANDNRDWGIPLSRRFKSLKVYMLLRMYGISGMRAYVQRICDMTEYMESLIVRLPGIRKFGATNYGLFCVQYYEEGMTQAAVNTATNRLCEFINNSHKMVLTHSNVRGHDIVRVAVTLERSTKGDIHESVAIFKQLLDDFRKQKEDAGGFSGVEVSTSQGNLLHDVDMGIVGSPNPTLSKTPTNVKSTISGESLVGPRTAASHVSSALTSMTQQSTLMPSATATAASPLPSINISAIKTEQLSSPAAVAAPPAPAANRMPPLTPAFEDPSLRTARGASSYNAPATGLPSAPSGPQTPAASGPAAPGTAQQPTFSAPEVTARSDTMTEKK